ncbi:MAG: MFS transporter [Thermoplasmata archaeon]
MYNGGNETKSLLYTSLGHFLNDGVYFLFPVIVTFFSIEKGFNPFIITLLFGLYYGSSALFTVYISYSSDISQNFGKNLSIGIALLSVGIAGLAYALTLSNFYYIFTIASISSIVMGIGGGYYHPLGAAILQKVSSSKTLGKNLGINGGMGSLGRALYPIVLFELIVMFNYNVSFGIISLIGFAGAFAIYLGLKNIDKGNSKNNSKSKGISSVKASLTKGVLILAIITFVRSIATQGIVSWLPTYLSYTRGLGDSLSLGIMMTVIYTIAIIGQPIFGILLDVMDKRGLFIIATIGTGITTLGFVYLSGTLGIVFLIAFSFFNFSGFPLLMSLTKDYVKETSSMSNSLVWGIAGNTGMFIGPVITGYILEGTYSNLPYSFVLLAVSIIIIGLISFMLPKPSEKSKMPLFG